MHQPRLLLLAVVVALANLAAGTVLISGTTSALSLGLGTVSISSGLVAGGAAVGALLVGKAALLAKVSKKSKRETASCLPFSNPDIYFQMAANSDFLGCARRFVCELEASPKASLVPEELELLELFGEKGQVVALPNSGRGVFAEAGAIGLREGLAGCAKAFESCPFDRSTIFHTFKTEQNTL